MPICKGNRPTMRYMTLPIISVLMAGSAAAQAPEQPESEPVAVQDYYADGQAELKLRLDRKPQEGRARNVILFIGDGMGVSTLTAGRIAIGQDEGKDGESWQTEIDDLPWGGLVKTYTHDSQVADSAGTATAMVTGTKTRNGVLGIAARVDRGDCRGALAGSVSTLFEQAEDKGLATGIVSTARITHATPASAYAHIADRDWEADSDLPRQARDAGCKDIASQMVNWPHGDGLDVMLGGGRSKFFPSNLTLPEGGKGERSDQRNLAVEWMKARPGRRTYVWNNEKLATAPEKGQLLGLFAGSHMQYEADRDSGPEGEPSLAEMTRIAIERLLPNEKGFVLMVEAGRIDHAHHAGNAARALADFKALDDAVKVARELTDDADTLIIVTADHSHTMTIAGYPARGNPILGLAGDIEGGTTAKASDGKPYTTLGYINGPGAVSAAERPDLDPDQVRQTDYRQQALIPLKSETHGGEDVAVKAEGPWAHLLTGTVEQNFLYHVMRHALGY